MNEEVEGLEPAAESPAEPLEPLAEEPEEPLKPPPPLEEEAISIEPVDEPPAPQKPAKKPKEQCPKCLRWYAKSVLRYKTHKCVPPVRDGENLADQKDAPKDGPKEEPVSLPQEEEPRSPKEEVLGVPSPPREKPPPPPPPARQVVAPEGLPSHEQVAKWVSYERESKRERKRARWEAQMFS